MVFLLKHTKRQSNTIHNELKIYSHRVLFTLFFVALASIGAYSISSVSTSRENHAISLVTSFYANLQKEEHLLYTYSSQANSDAYDELILQYNAILSILDKMEQLNVSALYKREIQDIAGIMEHYQQKMALIHEYRMNGKEPNVISQAYYASREIYEVAYRTFPTVYTEVVRACQNYAAITGRNRLIYLFSSPF